MILTATLVAAAAAIILSEVFGRGRVVYTRLFALGLAFAVACGSASLLVIRGGGSPSDGLAVALSVIPLMAAWLGFRIHLSNSVTLEMVTLIDEAGPQETGGVIVLYDPEGHTAHRIRILRQAGYLVGDDDRVASTAKGRAIIWLIHALCGPDGPRAVTAMLTRRNAVGSGR